MLIRNLQKIVKKVDSYQIIPKSVTKLKSQKSIIEKQENMDQTKLDQANLAKERILIKESKGKSKRINILEDHIKQFDELAKNLYFDLKEKIKLDEVK